MWLLRAKFELEVMGLNIKNERTNEPVSDFVDGSDTESTASNQSARSQSDKSSPMDQMVFYDVPPRLQEPDILQMFRNKEKSVLSASRLSWTPGDINLSAWQIFGQDMMSLNGAVVRDPARRQPMYIISLNNTIRKESIREGKPKTGDQVTPPRLQPQPRAISGNPRMSRLSGLNPNHNDVSPTPTDLRVTLTDDPQFQRPAHES